MIRYNLLERHHSDVKSAS